MTVKELIEELQEIQELGYGDFKLIRREEGENLELDSIWLNPDKDYVRLYF